VIGSRDFPRSDFISGETILFRARNPGFRARNFAPATLAPMRRGAGA
jgi:hypothetical protein